jgi:MSHA pilin protein MshA
MKFTTTLKQSRKNTQGFTLIELVVVIVILGILAATVAPKYIDLTAEAHTATLEAVKGSLEGASALVYSKSIIAGNQNLSSGTIPTPTIELPDGSLIINYGYPIVANDTDTYWRRIIDISTEFKITNINGVLIIYPEELEDVVFSTGTCAVTYSNSAGENEKPTITLFECI